MWGSLFCLPLVQGVLGLEKVEDPCLKDIKTWMTQNCLLLNSGKTEVVLFSKFRQN